MEYLLGIDLGTTNCTVTAIDEKGKTTLIKNRDGDAVTPSAVYFCEKKNNYIIGKKAKELAPDDINGQLVTLVKRQMGSEKTKVRKDRVTGRYKPYDYWGRLFSPEEISSKILKQLKEDAEAQLKTKVTKAVITCPAYFKQDQKEATRNAGKLAGFDVMEVITEPTAAALSYSTVSQKLNDNGKERVFVFDLGGGTFDVTIIDLSKDEKGISNVTKCTDGDPRLGGADWDNICRSDVIKEFKKKYNVNVVLEKGPDKERTIGRLTLDVERLKQELSKPDVIEATVTMEYKGRSIDVTYTRDQYAKVTDEFTDKCRVKCKSLMKDAGMTWDEIDTILMVGSMSNCLFIQDALKELSGKDVVFGVIDPKVCVSFGSALHAYTKYCKTKDKPSVIPSPTKPLKYEETIVSNEIIEGKKDKKSKRSNVTIIDAKSVLPASICLKGMKGGKEFCKQMLLKNEPYPCFFEADFPMSSDNMSEVQLPVFEGESEDPDENTELGQVILALEGNHSRKDTIHVKFEIDDSGIIQVSATDNKTNKSVVGKIVRNNLLSFEEIEEAKKESENDVFCLI